MTKIPRGEPRLKKVLPLADAPATTLGDPDIDQTVSAIEGAKPEAPQMDPALFRLIHEADFRINNVLVGWEAMIDKFMLDPNDPDAITMRDEMKPFLLDRIRAIRHAEPELSKSTDPEVQSFTSLLQPSVELLTVMIGFLRLANSYGSRDTWDGLYVRHKSTIDALGAHLLYRRFKAQVKKYDLEATRNTLNGGGLGEEPLPFEIE